ncbi:MAG: fatty acid desaturase [Myxococcota bacterium]
MTSVRLFGVLRSLWRTRGRQDAEPAGHAAQVLEFDSEQARNESFARHLDDLKQRVESRVGPEDLAHLRAVDRLRRRMKIAGRGLLYISPGPVSFLAGVAMLAVHRQLSMSMGHMIFHAVYDRFEGVGKYHSRRFRWDLPIDEYSWTRCHTRHHAHANILGRDPDMRPGLTRWYPRVPFVWYHRVQSVEIVANWLLMCSTINLHTAGLADVYFRGDDFDLLPDRSWRSIARAHWYAARRSIPYYLKEYVGYPLLAGPGMPKVVLGTWLASTVQDVFVGLAIYCGHIGRDVADYPRGARAHDRAGWYVMQVEATQNFEVPRWVSELLFALDHQIEHHLFPRLPHPKLREIAPEVRAICHAHGIEYKTGPWAKMIANTLRRGLSMHARPSTARRHAHLHH